MDQVVGETAQSIPVPLVGHVLVWDISHLCGEASRQFFIRSWTV